jgi:hypothetical protein
MKPTTAQAELFDLIWQPLPDAQRLRAGDVFLFNGRLCRVIRVNASDAVVTTRRRQRVFLTRFDKPVRFQPSPAIFYISTNSEVEILNRKPGKPTKRNHH